MCGRGVRDGGDGCWMDKSCVSVCMCMCCNWSRLTQTAAAGPKAKLETGAAAARPMAADNEETLIKE